MSSRSRAAALPDVPTTLEARFKDSDYTFWIGMFAPARTPHDIVERLNAELIKAVQTPSVKDKLEALGVETSAMSPSQFDAVVRAN
ncbi:MAG: tripartite tricarboxylate transporter substrate-binding protein [Pseudolabrys sp.]